MEDPEPDHTLRNAFLVLLFGVVYLSIYGYYFL
jgi:hypothetical protein